MGAESLVEVWDGAQYTKKQIKDLCDAPFYVKTLAGPAFAFPAYRKGFATLYRVELEDGRQFLATKDHRCLSPTGWVYVGRLVEGLTIAVDGISDDSHYSEKPTNSSKFDRKDSRSCDEQHSPLEVFVQEQIEQLAQSNTLSHRALFERSLDSCTDDFYRLVASQMASVNCAIAEKIAPSSLPRRIDAQVLDSRFDCPDILQLNCLPQFQVLQIPFFDETEHLLKEPEQAFRAEFHTVRQGKSVNTLLREEIESLPASQVLGDPRTMIPQQLFHGEGFDSPWSANSQSFLRFDPLVRPDRACKKSTPESWLEGEQAYNSHAGLPECSWSRVKSVTPVGDDYYYDFHVPVLNHYIADGVVHHNSGKSYSSVAKAILLAFRSQGEFHIYLEPTYVMLNDIAIPTWTKLLDKYDIPYTMRISPQPSFTLHLPKGQTTILLRPLMNVERLVGINAASLVIDEADTVKQEVAEAALIKLQGRVRVGKCPQICFASTPEGRKFVWNFFEKNKTEDKAVYRADTRQNPYLDENYVKDLLANYPPHLADAYIRGMFVNLETATVFSEFLREKHVTSVFHAEPNEPVLIGCDFNVGKSSSIYAVMRNSAQGQQLHIFEEFLCRDTFALAEHIKRRFPIQLAKGMCVVYPDSSGSHASTSSTMSDHDILREAGCKVIAERRNPPISETVAHVNNCLHRNQILINPSTCHDVIEMMESWGYDNSLKPAKGGAHDFSHFGDAVRYLTWQSMPRPGVGTSRGQRWR